MLHTMKRSESTFPPAGRTKTWNDRRRRETHGLTTNVPVVEARCANTGPLSCVTSLHRSHPDDGLTSKFTRFETSADIQAR